MCEVEMIARRNGEVKGELFWQLMRKRGSEAQKYSPSAV
jgi:hypothetical protein